MGWMKWVTAAMLLMMVIYLFPRAKYMLQNSPKGSQQEWLTFALLIGGVALFIGFLVMLVR